MSSYIWISQGMLGSVNLFGRSDIADRIKDGDVAVDFLRPVDVHAAAIATEVGKGLHSGRRFGVQEAGKGSVRVRYRQARRCDVI